MLRFVQSCILSLLVAIGAGQASAQVTFTQSAFPSGNDAGSFSITTGDFNNDGILDLVTVGVNSLSFYKGLGGGKYAAAITQSQPSDRGPVVAADFSRHGTPDLAIAGPNAVIIMIGQNNGTFVHGTDIPVNGAVQSIALADFNGDHLPDLAVSICPSSGACNSTIFLGQGNGTFKASSTLTDGGGQIVAGDFNADGHQDFAVVAGSIIALYLGNGNGSFQAPVVANANAVHSLALGDFYNNRIQTLVGLGGTFLGGGNFQTFIVSMRYANGQLLVENQRTVQDVTGVPFQQVVGGDLNGDFKDDIFLLGFDVNGQLGSYVLGNGNGTFQTPVDAGVAEESPSNPFIRDLDGDSRHDIGFAQKDLFDPASGAAVLRNTNAATNCTLPPAGQLVVHICAPANGQIVGQTFTFKGSGSAVNGIAKRIELWIDGKKRAQNLEDQLKATVTLTRGNHVASFVVVDSFDNHTSGSVSFTAQF